MNQLSKFAKAVLYSKRGLFANARLILDSYNCNETVRQLMDRDGITPDFIKPPQIADNIKKFLPGRFNSDNCICMVKELTDGMDVSEYEIKEVNGHNLVYIPYGKFTINEFYSLVCAAKRQQLKFEGYDKSLPFTVKHLDNVDYRVKYNGRMPNSSLVVTFPDGSRICEKFARDTFHTTIMKIGVNAVLSCNERIYGVPLISKVRDTRYGKCQRELGRGLLLIVAGSVKSMARVLNRINSKLRIGLLIEILD